MARYYTDFSADRLGTLTEYGYLLSANCSATSSSSLSSGSLSYLTDGYTNYNPYVSVGTTGQQWVQVDLENVYVLNAVRVWHYWNGGRSYYSPRTDVSEDGVTWTTVSTPAEYSEVSSGNLRTFPPIKARYIRDYISGSTANTGSHWLELQAFGYPTDNNDWSIVYNSGTRNVYFQNDGTENLLRVDTQSNGNILLGYSKSKNVTGTIESITQFSVSTPTPNPGSYGILNHNYNSNGGFSVALTPVSDVLSVILFDDKSGNTVVFANFAWTVNTKYWARYRTEGIRQKFKIWEDGTPEPSAWLMEADYDIGSIAGDKYSGLGTYTANSYLRYYKYGFATGGDTAPTEPPAVPSSTPQVGYSGGYGGTSGFGRGYGQALRPAFINIDLLANDTYSNLSSSNILLGQKHKLVVASDSHGHTVTGLGITQVHNIPVDSTEHSLDTESPEPVYNIHLVTSSGKHTLTTTSPELLDEYIIPVHSSVMSLVSEIIQLEQKNEIVVNNAKSSLTSSNIAVTEDWTIVVNDIDHDTASDNISILQDYLLEASDTLSNVQSDLIDLHQYAVLLIESSEHTTKSDNLNVIHFTLLNTPDSTNHAVGSNEITIEQLHNILIENGYSNVSSDNIRIINWSDYDKHFGNYSEGTIKKGVINIDSIGSGQISEQLTKETGVFELGTITKGSYSEKKYDIVNRDID